MKPIKQCSPEQLMDFLVNQATVDQTLAMVCELLDGSWAGIPACCQALYVRNSANGLVPARSYSEPNSSPVVYSDDVTTHVQCHDCNQAKAPAVARLNGHQKFIKHDDQVLAVLRTYEPDDWDIDNAIILSDGETIRLGVVLGLCDVFAETGDHLALAERSRTDPEGTRRYLESYAGFWNTLYNETKGTGLSEAL